MSISSIYLFLVIEDIFILPCILRGTLTGHMILGGKFFFFSFHLVELLGRLPEFISKVPSMVPGLFAC